MLGSLSWLAARRSLTARGQFLTTFAGLGFALALSLLALGGYLIAEQFRDPVQAGASELLFAALLIATAVTLLYCLLHPSRKLQPRYVEWAVASPREPATLFVAAGTTETVVVGNNREATEVARAYRDKRLELGSHWGLHDRYVDRTRVHTRRGVL